jgi:integrase
MTRTGYSPYTIRGALTPLGRIFRHAERRNLIPSCPLRRLESSERPASSSGERRSLTADETQKLLAAADKHRALIAVGAYTGLRLSESLGLTWEDVDFAGEFIRVRKQLARDDKRTDLKTIRSRRDVVLIPGLATILKSHRMATTYKPPTDYVFVGRGVRVAITDRRVTSSSGSLRRPGSKVSPTTRCGTRMPRSRSPA